MRTVWIVNPFDNLPGEGFRPGRYELLARALTAAGARVVWLTSDWSHTRKCVRAVPVRPFPGLELVLVNAAARPYRRNVSLARISNHRLFASAAIVAARRLGSEPADRPDLVLVSLPPLSAAAGFLDLRREWGFKLAVDVQDAWPETFERLFPRGLRALARPVLWPLRRLARRLYREADLVTGTCDGYAELVRAYGARTYYRACLAHAAEARPRRKSAEKGLRFVYIGNLGRSYDLATVIAAVNALPDATLDIAGDAPPRREGRVTWHGYLADAELKALLAECDIGVVPLRDDSFIGIPNKVADYAAAGLYVLSSLRGECAAFLERTGLGAFYEPGDSASLVAAAKAAAAELPKSRALPPELDAAQVYPAFAARLLEFAGTDPRICGDRPQIGS